jgi:hypothetical protein
MAFPAPARRLCSQAIDLAMRFVTTTSGAAREMRNNTAHGSIRGRRGG